MEGKAGAVDASWVCHVVYCNNNRLEDQKWFLCRLIMNHYAKKQIMKSGYRLADAAQHTLVPENVVGFAYLMMNNLRGWN